MRQCPGNRMRRTVFNSVALALVALSPIAHAQSDERRFLKGLGSVYVLVEQLSADAERRGLTEATLKTDVELRLRQAGMHVAEDYVDQTLHSVKSGKSSTGHVYVRVTIVANEGAALAAYTAEVSLMQMACTRNTPEEWCFSSATWSKSGTALVGMNKLRESVRSVVKDHAEELMNDYLAVNPKRP